MISSARLVASVVDPLPLLMVTPLLANVLAKTENLSSHLVLVSVNALTRLRITAPTKIQLKTVKLNLKRLVLPTRMSMLLASALTRRSKALFVKSSALRDLVSSSRVPVSALAIQSPILLRSAALNARNPLLD